MHVLDDLDWKEALFFDLINVVSGPITIVPQPGKHHVRIHVVAPCNLRNRNTRHPRLTANPALLLVAPQSARPLLRHPRTPLVSTWLSGHYAALLALAAPQADRALTVEASEHALDRHSVPFVTSGGELCEQFDDDIDSSQVSKRAEADQA